MPSQYETLRIKNIADNQRILSELGLLNPYKPLPRVIKKSIKRKREPSLPSTEKKYIVNLSNDENVNQENLGSVYGTRRRSSRVLGQDAPSAKEIQECIDAEELDEEERKERRKSMLNRPKVYGIIPGVPVGKWWATRIECNVDGIHRPTVAGIHGGPEGAYSLALSGGYEDDIDLGDCFTYTGEGGRDLKGTVNKPKNLRTAPQSKDQCLSRGNAALVKSVETEMPVRVIRGYKLHSAFAPDEGYRYDGLYKVEKHWYTTGLAGFGVFKFVLRRLTDQAPPPWTLEGQSEGGDSGVVSDAGSDVMDNESVKDDDENNNDIKMLNKEGTEEVEKLDSLEKKEDSEVERDDTLQEKDSEELKQDKILQKKEGSEKVKQDETLQKKEDFEEVVQDETSQKKEDSEELIQDETSQKKEDSENQDQDISPQNKEEVAAEEGLTEDGEELSHENGDLKKDSANPEEPGTEDNGETEAKDAL